MEALDNLLKSYRREHPAFQPGDTVKVHLLVREREKERIQIFQGVVIGIKGNGLSQTFTVRKISDGVGVERVFPIHSPFVKRIQKIKRGQVRRAKLYFLRGLRGKAMRLKETIFTVDDSVVAVPAAKTPPDAGTETPA